MKYKVLRWLSVLTAASLQLASLNSQAQSSVLINAFNTESEVTDNNGQPWQNWFGTAFYQVLWDGSDASNNLASGSLKVEAFFPNSGIGGCCGPQFVVMNAYDGINPPLAGNGNATTGIPVATNVEFDVRFEADSIYNTNAANWPTIEVGTRGSSLSQYTFGTFTVPHSETAWVHVSVGIAPSANWTNIPHVFFKRYDPNANGWLKFYIDNIRFTMADVPVPPPTLAAEKAGASLRMLAGPARYDRTQLASVNTNQSWVGAANYPVSYSVTISGYDTNPPLNEFHMFLLPLNYVEGALDQFSDYDAASNSLRLQITGGAPGTSAVIAQMGWKTNLVNENPTNVVLNITNGTGLGTWTVTFNSATSGTLTAPGASPAAFTLPADVAATFANPLVAVFGVQPNPLAAIGQFLDIARIRTINIPAPGVSIDTDFTTATSIDTNIWQTSSVSADSANLILVPSTAALWLSWGYPDGGVTLATKADLGATGINWKTPAYYTGYASNAVLQRLVGANNYALIPTSALPTVNGLSNGVPGTSAFFRMQKPAPVE